MSTSEPFPASGRPLDAGDPDPAAEDPYAHALRDGGGPLFLRRADGGSMPTDVGRWCAGADAADMSVLHRCEGSVLDIGCGPGRLVAALQELGHAALGIDISAAAVARTEDVGGSALRRSVFDRLPDEGHWRSALLMDGNIGIGGDPPALLRRIAGLVDPEGGLLMVETASADVDEQVRVRFDDGMGHAGAPFPWARIGCHALSRMATATGWTPLEPWSVGERHFLELRRQDH
ncbi:class I SAM-dependent methyltransferase [Streptomyces tsukubensis]|uniref:class I SAM-dependent methyltransferase n=1 Tax=Streptomyces tsukubensis TaxID=83656 RepID=UPI00098EAD9B|nr:methyltransferase domain-containing protein [Streptomyces tsukubensis]